MFEVSLGQQDSLDESSLGVFLLCFVQIVGKWTSVMSKCWQFKTFTMSVERNDAVLLRGTRLDPHKDTEKPAAIYLKCLSPKFGALIILDSFTVVARYNEQFCLIFLFISSPTNAANQTNGCH